MLDENVRLVTERAEHLNALAALKTAEARLASAIGSDPGQSEALAESYSRKADSVATEDGQTDAPVPTFEHGKAEVSLPRTASE